MTISASLNLCKSLLKDEKEIFKAFKKVVSFEIAIGLNGK